LVGWIRIDKKIAAKNKSVYKGDGDSNILVFIPNAAKYAHFFRQMPMMKKIRKNSKNVDSAPSYKILKSLATDLGAGVHVLEDGQLLVGIHLDQVLSKINDDF
jgi:hypothetical protein